MNVIITLDNRNGMLFNGRRLSRDRVLNERILARAGGKLFLNAYSAGLFAGSDADLTVCEDFADRAGQGDFCFVEAPPLAPYESSIETLTVYRWNRDYPSDCTLDLSLNRWKLISANEFPGSSHDTIREEVYRK